MPLWGIRYRSLALFGLLSVRARSGRSVGHSAGPVNLEHRACLYFNFVPSVTLSFLSPVFVVLVDMGHAGYNTQTFCSTFCLPWTPYWTELTSYKRLKERFLIGQNTTKRAHFRGSPLFQATHDIKTEKQAINSTYLVSVGCGRLAEGKGHETDWRNQEKGQPPHIQLTQDKLN